MLLYSLLFPHSFVPNLKMNMKRSLILTFLICTGFGAMAQQPVEISLDGILARVRESNADIRLSEQEAHLADYDLQYWDSFLLPKLSLSHTAMSTTNPLMAFGFKLNQEVLTQADFDPVRLNDPEAINSFVTELSLELPLVNLDGLQRRKAGKIRAEAMDLYALRTRQRLEYEAFMAYGQLQLAHKTVEVLEKARGSARENLDMVQDRYGQGLLNKAELLEAKVRLSSLENQLNTAKSQVANASDRLGFLMDRGQGVVYRPKEELRTVQDIPPLGGSLDHRADIRAMELIKEAQLVQLRAERLSFLPRFNAFANYQLHDDQIFHGGAKGYLVGASLSWDIFKGTQRSATVGKSRTHYEKAKLEQQKYLAKGAMELLRIGRRIEDAGQNEKSTKLAMEQAGEALRIRRDRFREGLERTTDLLMAETLHAQSQLEHYQAILQYNQALALYTFLTQE